MKKSYLVVLSLFVAVTLIYFFPVFKGNVPFPGDLLIGEYTPYNAYPYKGYVPGSYPNKGQNFDVIRLIYPAKFFSIEQLKVGVVPLWNPHIFAGNPHMASLQSGTFYPLNIIFFILPFPIAWSVYIIIQPILAAFFTFLLLRILNLSKVASFFGGITFAFSSYFTVWIEYGNLNHTYLWMPLILYLIISIIRNPIFYKYLALVFVLSFSILAGYIQSAIYVFIFAYAFLLFYLLFVEKRRIKKNIFYITLCFIFSVALSGIQLLPMVELFLQSTRRPFSSDEYIQLLIPFYHIITFIVPDFFGNPATRNYWLEGTYIERVSYVGIIPAFFVLYALISRINRVIWFFIGSFLFTFLLVFDTFFSRILYSLFIPPILSTGVPSRMMFIFCFSISIIAAFGINSFIEKFNFKKTAIIIVVFLFVFLLIWTFTFFNTEFFFKGVNVDQIAISKRNLIVPTAIAVTGIIGFVAYLYIKKIRQILIFCFVLLTIADLFYFFYKITPFAPTDSVYPTTSVMKEIRNIQGIDRSWGYGSGYIDANIQTMEGIYGSDGYDALHIKRYAEFLSFSELNSNSLARSEAELQKGFGTADLKINTQRQRIMDILGIKYVINKNETLTGDTLTFPEDVYSFVSGDGAMQIYENNKSLPRAYFVDNIIVENNKDEIISKILNKDFDIYNVAIVEEALPMDISKDSESSIQVDSYQPNSVILKTSSSTNTFLVLTDNYYEGWGVTIDEKKEKIYRTNYTFRGVVVPKGEHVVKFTYSPLSFKVGMIITVLTLIGILTPALIILIKAKRKS